ncbi:hypothetical protein LZ32DRAFT_136130 [Colletotrichum eremochloae]|nr:hypothetical protein LZ32DRAFT_136130 [Colletotrichum eremochloae]
MPFPYLDLSRTNKGKTNRWAAAADSYCCGIPPHAARIMFCRLSHAALSQFIQRRR